MAMAVPSPSHAATGVDMAFPSDHDAAQSRVVRPTAAATLSGLATVELQLIMQHCDAQSLLALARCSRFTLSAASDPFAWRGLSSFSLVFVHTPDAEPDAGQRRPKISAWQRLCCCIRPPPSPLPLPLAQRISASLLRFSDLDIKINWRGDDQYSPVSDAELDGLAAIPRLRALDSCGRWKAGPAQLESLVRRPGLRGLTTLTCSGRQLDEAVTEALAENCPRLSTVTSGGSNTADPPLHLLPALTDLTVRVHHEGGVTMAAVARCARLRRLRILPDSQNGTTLRDVHTAILSPNLRTLEHLSIHGLDAIHADGRNQPAVQLDWAAAFANLPALRSLHLEDPRGIDELLTAIGAGCAQLQSVRLYFTALSRSGGPGSVAPSRVTLAALLERTPSLRSVALSMPPLEYHASFMLPDGLPGRVLVWQRAHEELSALVALAPDRVSLRLE